MKNQKKYINIIVLSLITILNIFSYTFAFSGDIDTSAPKNCSLKTYDSKSNDTKYTNSRFVNLELYFEDESNVQVWLSNDGENGTVFDLYKNNNDELNIITLPTDGSFEVGNIVPENALYAKDINTKNFYIKNWPLSTINGNNNIYAVFIDSNGNRTSISNLKTIVINLNFNNLNVKDYKDDLVVETCKGLPTYLPALELTSGEKTHAGWSYYSLATIPNFPNKNLGLPARFNSNTTLYAILNH